ncbi:MAG: hypothetical protein IIA27_16135, partial [Gemmatimonadetes bacterium]|nr:hypothetical protein [Gemmatimonadota bacterium]
DQLVSQAAKMRYMFGGQATLPVVYRATMFYGGGSAAHHSDRSYPLFMNIPGFKIVVPSNPADMKGLLKSAIRDDDPCIVFEDGTLSGMRGEVPDDSELPLGELIVPFGEAKVVREGTDCTVVGIAASVNHAVAAADQLAQEGISIEVIDPRTLVPFDKETVLKSVEKTGRLVIADPAHKVCSAASEIASIVAEEGFWSLQAPIQKVASEQVHIPYSPALEKLGTEALVVRIEPREPSPELYSSAVDFLLLPALLIAFDRRPVTAKEREPQLAPASGAPAPALG